ncbi:hypothetical protein GGR50DRAFT_93967 [Xylaria sp. CBS 124048]|nr:hypothetical protein GGR50DRAFT_93967 [Xylaria sp. CBS 124048]
MLLRRALLLGAYSSIATADVVSSSTLSCSYRYGSEPGGVAPTPIPSIIESTYTASRTVIRASTVPSTVTVSVSSTVTVTQVTETALTFFQPTVTEQTLTIGVATISIVATAIFTKTVCGNDAKPVTVTEYTGTYAPLSGQDTTLPVTYPTEAACIETLVLSTLRYPTVTSGVVTTTVTPSSTVASPRTTMITNTIVLATSTLYLTTETIRRTTYTPVASTTTSTIPCSGETVTRTLNAQCAPTNLLRSINGHGLLYGVYADGSSVIYTRDEPWSNDPSICCQTCLDNGNCGASSGNDGACGLYYRANADAESVCNTWIMSVNVSPNIYPGQGSIVQSGCDTIDYIV